MTVACTRGGVGLRSVQIAALMASTTLAGTPALAAEVAAAPRDVGEIVVTASKREENIQKVAMSIQAIDTKKLNQLNVTSFQDYVKFMPSVAFQTLAPNQTTIYMRGVADGGNANHSGPQPSVGAYLDEQPITTIGGTLDIHVYDIARVEVLPGPQGTLYGASSESGTLKIITNKPSTAGFSGGIDVQGNTVAHGSQGGVVEGFVNVPLASNVAIRLVGFAERDAGYIDNVPGTRPFKTSGATITNAGLVAKDFNHTDTYGGRAAIKFDLGADWTIMPTVVAQETIAPGVFAYEPSVGYLQTQRFLADTYKDRWLQAALNITGKLGRFDIVYSGGLFQRNVDAQSDYTDYSVAYDQRYGSGGYWKDSTGNPLTAPQQLIIGKDHFSKESNEFRISSPASDRFRVIAGVFQERQKHHIVQDYVIQGFGTNVVTSGGDGEGGGVTTTSFPLAVPGWPNTIWLTNQERKDSDEAAFAEAAFDITSKFTVTGGIRLYHYNNSLFGFYGYSQNYDEMTGYGSGQGAGSINCQAGKSFPGAPCVNLDKTAVGSGETHKVNLTYKVSDDALVYFTYSTGYRPGGVNRSGTFAPYGADHLSNFELGWKTSWRDHTIHFNGAVYDEEWNQFQFAFLGPNSLTIVENAPSARIMGVESSFDWRTSDHLTLSGGGAYNHAVLSKNFCQDADLNVIATCADADATAVHGTQLPYTPKFKGHVTARYTVDLGEWKAHAQGSLLYQTMNFVGVRTADNTSLGTMPAYATADFSIGAEHDKTSFELFVKNAFDAKGQVNRYTSCTIASCAQSYPGVAPAVYVVPIQPLTVGIKVGQKF